MNSLRWQATLGTAVLCAILPGLEAQQTAPHIGYIYPAGGRQGATFEVTVGGQFLGGVNGASISGSGVDASIVEYNKPLTMGQYKKLREQLQEMIDKRKASGKWTPEDEKTSADIRKKLAGFVRRPIAPQIVEQVRVQVRLAHDSPPGERELRLMTAGGLTNPLVFCVGQLPEFSKTPARPVDEQVSTRTARYQPAKVPQPPMKVALPAVVNGQIMPGGVDKIQFQAAKGQHLVVAAGARQLIPYISDAVPGWFQATLGLFDAKGNEVTYADHFGFHQDPVLYYEIPNDGEYTLVVKDSIYRGREDFVYRIQIGELPYVTGIFPLGGKAGAKTTLEVTGWNLPSPKLSQNTKGKEGIVPVTVSKGEWISNRVPFAVDALPEKLEREPNNQTGNAQRLKLPVVVNGRINQPGDTDVFRIDGRAGEEIVAEVLARRLDSPLDSILKLTDGAGKELAVNDDFEDKAAGLITHHADSLIRFKLPASGPYYIQLGDTQHKGGSEYTYRLRIAHPQPDYELRVVPSSISARGGATVPITVYALRRDGFSGEIVLKLKDAPAGFMLSGGIVQADQDKVRLTLTLPAKAAEKALSLHLEGRAQIQGREVHRQGIPAEDMMQAFYYHHLVPSTAWLVRVSGSSRAKTAWKPQDKPVKLPAGGSAPVEVFVPAGRFAGDVKLALNEPPEGIAIQKVSPGREGLSIMLSADPAKAKPGLRGNLIVDAYTERAANKTAKRRTALGTLPAIPFEVVSR